jgi:pyruvate dehydrogenase E1 component beta subunit
MTYDATEDVPEDEWTVPLSEAAVRREGSDLTIVATSYMCQRALAAAETLADEISIEVIDPRTIVPLDLNAILASVSKTGRLMVVHEANTCGGFGAEVVRRVTENRFDALRCAPRVLGQIGVPMPFSHVLEKACVPQEDDIIAVARSMIKCDQSV